MWSGLRFGIFASGQRAPGQEAGCATMIKIVVPAGNRIPVVQHVFSHLTDLSRWYMGAAKTTSCHVCLRLQNEVLPWPLRPLTSFTFTLLPWQTKPSFRTQ